MLGASGQVGQALFRELKARGWRCEGSYFEHPEVAPGLFHLDLADLKGIRDQILSRRPNALFLPSGWTWVDGCEDDPQRAFLINARAPEAAAQAAALLQCACVYYSTEYVFGEEGGPYDELRAPDPVGVYGASKLEGEARVLSAWSGSLVLRTTVVYGPDRQKKNFVCQLVKALSEGKPMKVPADQVSSPTYNRDLARASVDLVERKLRGLWNVAGQGTIDRYHFAKIAARVFGLDADLISPVATADLRQKARRPLGAGLDIEKLAKTLAWSPRSPETGLVAMREEMEAEDGRTGKR